MNKSTDKALTFLNNKLQGVSQLTICDPYILTPKAKSKSMGGGYFYDEYFARFNAILTDRLQRLHLVYNSNYVAKELFDEIQKRLPYKLTVTHQAHDEIHDRVWVLDGIRAFVTGTSLNTIGARLSFIIELDGEDFNSFKAYMTEHKIFPFDTMPDAFAEIAYHEQEAERVFEQMKSAVTLNERVSLFPVFMGEFEAATQAAKKHNLKDEEKRLTRRQQTCRMIFENEYSHL